jgi:hypothetical protein
MVGQKRGGLELEQREINVAEFNGYVKAKLEDIGDNLGKIDKKLDVLDTCVNKMKMRVAAIGGTVSLVVTILVLIIKEVLGK